MVRGGRGAAQKENFAQKRFANPDEKTTFLPLNGAECYKDERSLNSIFVDFSLCFDGNIYLHTSKSDQYERETFQ